MPFSIVDDARPDSVDFETSALISPSGFREYDARWWFGLPGSDRAPELNLVGVFAGQGIADLVTVNGVRVVGPDATWGLVRASSNEPELVVVPERRCEMFEAVDALLRQNPEVGRYNQTF